MSEQKAKVRWLGNPSTPEVKTFDIYPPQGAPEGKAVTFTTDAPVEVEIGWARALVARGDFEIADEPVTPRGEVSGEPPKTWRPSPAESSGDDEHEQARKKK